jgi:hypothetical protein
MVVTEKMNKKKEPINYTINALAKLYNLNDNKI